MIRGAIFDVDGTLLDSMSIWNTIGEDYLRSLGMEPHENLAETFKRFSLDQAARYYQTEYGVSLSVAEIMSGVNGMIEQFYIQEAPMKPGAAQFLRQLRSRNVKMCIATATDRDLVEAAFRRCGIEDCFSEIFTCTSVGHSKNEPHIYRAAWNHLGTAKEETYVFEDALHAAQTAALDGFPVIAVYDPSESQQRQLQEVSQGFLKDFQDLSPIQGIL